MSNMVRLAKEEELEQVNVLRKQVYDLHALGARYSPHRVECLDVQRCSHKTL